MLKDDLTHTIFDYLYPFDRALSLLTIDKNFDLWMGQSTNNYERYIWHGIKEMLEHSIQGRNARTFNSEKTVDKYWMNYIESGWDNDS